MKQIRIISGVAEELGENRSDGVRYIVNQTKVQKVKSQFPKTA